METSTRYRLTRLIRRGAVTELFEGTVQGEHGFVRRVAIKRLLYEHAADPDTYQRFIEEARLASNLAHGNIVPVIDFGVLDGLPFQVLELVDGVDLLTVGPTLPVDLAIYVVSEVAQGLDYAHRATDLAGAPLHLVHRDVSPDNILIAWSGEVKLTDFGIAVFDRRRVATQPGIALGKLAYMAPEQFRGERVDPRADVFSLGCVLFELLAKRSPLADESARRDLLTGRPLPLPEAVAPVRHLLERALAPGPDARYPDAGAFAEALAEAQGRTSARNRLRERLESFRTVAEAAPRRPLSEMMRVDLVLDTSSDDAEVRRFSIEDSTAPGSEAPTVDALVGARLSEYRLVERIGRGGFGSVYRAEHAVTGQTFAIKLLHAMRMATPEERLRREGEALQNVRHPNLVEVFDLGVTDDGRPYIVMELLQGAPLGSLIANGPLAWERAAAIVRQLAAALGAVHDRGWVHRDLKPSNVMVIEHGGTTNVKLLDFSLTRLVDPAADRTRLTAPDGLLGTPRFMAPEQAENPHDVDARADLYALGLLLVWLVSGPESLAGSPLEVLRRRLREPPPDPPEAGELRPLLARLFARDPSARPASAREVVAFIDALSLGAARPAVSGGRTRWRAGGLLAAALLAGGALWLQRRHGLPRSPISASVEPPPAVRVTPRVEPRAEVPANVPVPPPPPPPEPPRKAAAPPPPPLRVKPIDAAALEATLRSIRAALVEVRARLDADTFATLERRYLDLRTAAAKGPES